MGLIRIIRRFVMITLASLAGAAVGDYIRQQVTGEKGRVLVQSKEGSWTVNLPPSILIPGIIAGFRSKNWSLPAAFFSSALASGTRGKGLGGMAKWLGIE